MPTESYLSQVELPITFGLGTDEDVRKVTVHWPDGSQQAVEVTGVDRMHEVRQTAEPRRKNSETAQFRRQQTERP